MGFFQPIHLPRLSARWATVLLNLVALTYSTNTVFVKSIEEAPAKPIPSLACLVRFLIATVALGVLSQLFTSKPKAAPVAEKGFSKETRAGARETSQVLNKAETQISEGTPRNRRASRELPLRSREELGDLFEIPLDSSKGIRSSPRLSPFGFAPAGWQREASTPRDGLQDQAALHSKATLLSQVELNYVDGLYKGAEDKMQSNHSHGTEDGKPRSPVVASVELGVLMFLGFGAQAVALETAKAGQVSLLFTISVSNLRFSCICLLQREHLIEHCQPHVGRGPTGSLHLSNLFADIDPVPNVCALAPMYHISAAIMSSESSKASSRSYPTPEKLGSNTMGSSAAMLQCNTPNSQPSPP
jgi:hypothetical protein